MNLPFWIIPAWQKMCWGITQQRVAHAVLMLSRPGLGVDLLATAYAHRLLCLTATNDGFACGHCAGCALTLAGHHPDLLTLTIPEEKKGIGIEQIRELTQRLQQSAHRGGFRVAIIHDADTMSSGAANALLKTLEEPGADSVLMLLSTQPEKISATIRSRCSKLLLNAPAQEPALEWLMAQTSQSIESLKLALASAAGGPLLVLERLRSHDEHDRELLAQVDALLRRETDPLLIAGNCSDAERLLDVLLRRSAMGMQGTSAMVWAELNELTLEARRLLRGSNNLTPLHVLEQLLLRWFDLARKLDHSKLV